MPRNRTNSCGGFKSTWGPKDIGAMDSKASKVDSSLKKIEYKMLDY
ncbi:hypothetical protein BJV85_002361 [Clostridium acetobutylicum]|nr:MULTISPECIES: hypothetical protein [Clostridium]MBC2394055.1 hypothetical protein [Clostridium acetobutylicum]MBC2586666.1 hypothetical protein [Clostridium acetobutylicum]NOV90462.1 hypothetical protein [Clostridium acetobutylicum]NOW15013.1 hypothetical protein [Clostridium acetobutylicum]NRY56693.1 hypothetical protein [Clostridium acetobutylicum]